MGDFLRGTTQSLVEALASAARWASLRAATCHPWERWPESAARGTEIGVEDWIELPSSKTGSGGRARLMVLTASARLAVSCIGLVGTGLDMQLRY